MTRPNRFSLAASLLLFPLFAPAQGLVEYCPAAGSNVTDECDGWNCEGGVDLLDLIWDLDDGGTASIVRPGDAIQVLTSVFPAEDSQCRITTQITMTDADGNVLFTEESEIGDNVGLLLRGIDKEFDTSDIPVGQGSPVFIDIRGTATGCTTGELRSFAPVLQKLEPPANTDIVDVNLIDLGSYGVKRRQALDVRFRLKAGSETDTVGRALQLDCPGGAKPLPISLINGVKLNDVIWDFKSGGISQAQAAQSELLIFVTPPILNQSCRKPPEYVVDFLPKVFVDVAISDQQGNITTLLGELDANNPAQSFPVPQGINGGRKQYAFQVGARSPGCVAAHGGVVNALLITRNGHSTEVEQPLGVIVRKDVPPDPILE